ncbi:unnamed protein product [Arctia plantaginis]|uniref:Peptidase S1 domain-containing protein n=1 Tax=Arctia plantaginis TaxID=874455 RepID=A0A8S1A532_ARCPL|nr:unnamed protein product [Arctia plantaginis]
MRVIFTFVLCLAIAFAVPSHPNKIVGGFPTNIESYPSIAALLYTRNGQTYFQACGGTILTTKAILTAAHCPHGDAPFRWRARLGSSRANSGGTVFNFASISIHPSFNPNTMNNDVAIMRTSSNINYNNAIQPASIASPNYHLADNQVVWAAGWGTTYVSIK